MKRKYAKLLFFIFIGCFSVFILFHMNTSGFISTTEVFKNFDKNYFKNTIILLTVAFVFCSFAAGFSSTSIQNINRNNIATGSTLGIGAAGGLGYLISNYFLNYNYFFVISIMLIFSFVPAILNLFFLSRKKSSNNNTILLGLAITSFLGVISYILRDKLGSLNTSLIWLGSFHGQSTWNKFFYSFPMFLVGFFIILLNSKKITIISRSKELAQKQNINFNLLYFTTTIGNLLIITSATFFIGEITFLGIIGTNIARKIFKTSSTIVIAFSSSFLNILIILIANIFYVYFKIDILLTVVVISIPIFIFIILKEKAYA